MKEPLKINLSIEVPHGFEITMGVRPETLKQISDLLMMVFFGPPVQKGNPETKTTSTGPAAAPNMAPLWKHFMVTEDQFRELPEEIREFWNVEMHKIPPFVLTYAWEVMFGKEMDDHYNGFEDLHADDVIVSDAEGYSVMREKFVFEQLGLVRMADEHHLATEMQTNEPISVEMNGLTMQDDQYMIETNPGDKMIYTAKEGVEFPQFCMRNPQSGNVKYYIWGINMKQWHEITGVEYAKMNLKNMEADRKTGEDD